MENYTVNVMIICPISCLKYRFHKTQCTEDFVSFRLEIGQNDIQIFEHKRKDIHLVMAVF